MSSRKTPVCFKVRDLESWRRFKELCEREGSSMSEKLEEWILQYVREHWPGNPQLPLSKWLEACPTKKICVEGERGLCPQRPDLCVLRRRYACKFEAT
jgi:hypothetical protein